MVEKGKLIFRKGKDMYYKAKNVDTDKALEALSEARRFQESEVNLEIEKKRAYLSGVCKGLDIGESIFECSNYEKKEEVNGYVQGIQDFYDKVLNFEDHIEPCDIKGGVLLYSGVDISNMIAKVKTELID